MTVNVLRGGEVINDILKSLGIRTFRIDEKVGFLFNGQPYLVYGLGRHQDLKNKAWVMTEEDNERDYAAIK